MIFRDIDKSVIRIYDQQFFCIYKNETSSQFNEWEVLLDAGKTYILKNSLSEEEADNFIEDIVRIIGKDEIIIK